ncbi:MAG: hypothetical protein ACK5ZG_11890 [Phycisphaerae bacterium]
MPDYIPRREASLVPWVNQMSTVVGDWYAGQGIDNKLVNEVLTLREAFAEAFAASVAADAAARAATAAKDAARDALLEAVRMLAQQAQHEPDMDNSVRVDAGLTARKATRTRTSTPRVAPLVSAAPVERFVHELRLVVEGEAAGSSGAAVRKAKPKGVQRAEVYRAIANADAPMPTDDAAFVYVDSVSESAARFTLDGQAVGKQAYYKVRYVSSRGQRGPWSNVASATVAA